MSWQQFLALACAHFLALLSPGPDFFLLLNHSIAHGHRAGCRTALGIACANGVFILVALAGVSGLREQPLALALLYWGGCAYLLWLGVQFWRARAVALPAATGAAAGGAEPACFLRGFASGILNPKNALFYLTLFAVLGQGSGSARALAGLWMFAVVLGWDCLVSALLTRPPVLAAFARRLPLLHRGSACVLFCLAGVMIASAAGSR